MKIAQDLLDEFVDALRSELHGYGELLALMESQQSRIISRDTLKIESSAHEVNSQFEQIQKLKRLREESQARLSVSMGLLPDAQYAEQRQYLPADFRNLTDALVEENNDLLKKVRKTAKQNQMLLFRTVEMMQEFINHIIPRTDSPAYDATGATRSDSRRAGLYEAIG